MRILLSKLLLISRFGICWSLNDGLKSMLMKAHYHTVGISSKFNAHTYCLSWKNIWIRGRFLSNWVVGRFQLISLIAIWKIGCNPNNKKFYNHCNFTVYILGINKNKFKVKMVVKSYDLLCITAFVMASRDERGW